MFHPIYNEDGSISYFRIACLAVFFVCVILEGIIFFSDVESSTSVQNTENNTVKAETKFSQKKLDSRLVGELFENLNYLQYCAVVDKSFENCPLTFSNTVLKYYSVDFDAASDGFSLALKATDSYTKNECTDFKADSSGMISAYNRDGSINLNCLMGRHIDAKSFKIYRDTDDKKGQMAPSGLDPINEN